MTDDKAVEGPFSQAELEEGRRAGREMSCQIIKEYIALAKRRLADVEAALDRRPEPADRLLAVGVREALDMAMGEVDDLLQGERPQGERSKRKRKPVTPEPPEEEDNGDFGFGGSPSPGHDQPVPYALDNIVGALNWWTLLKSPTHFEEARQAMLTCLADARDTLQPLVQERSHDDAPGEAPEPQGAQP